MQKLTAMKRLSIIILTVSAFSCSDMLEEVPRDFVSNVNFWQTEEDAEAGVRGIYGVDLIDPYNQQFLELHSDYAEGRGSWAAISFWNTGFDQSHIGRATTYWWNRPYQAINRCNTVIDNVPSINMSEEKKQAIIAEAK